MDNATRTAGASARHASAAPTALLGSRILPSRARCLWAATALALLWSLCVVIGVWTPPGQSADRWVDSIVHNWLPTGMRRGLDSFARPLAPIILAPIAAGLILLGVVRRRVGEAIAATLTASTVPLTLWLRETGIHRPDLGIEGYAFNTFPSTHATAAFAALAAIAIMWPVPVGRVSLTLFGALAVTVGLGNVSWYAHRPVDVLGSALLVLTVALLGLALLPWRRWRRVRSETD